MHILQLIIQYIFRVHFSINEGLSNHVKYVEECEEITSNALWRLLSTYLQEFMEKERFGVQPFRNIIEHIT